MFWTILPIAWNLISAPCQSLSLWCAFPAECRLPEGKNLLTSAVFPVPGRVLGGWEGAIAGMTNSLNQDQLKKNPT